jgi:hypothetical protein
MSNSSQRSTHLVGVLRLELVVLWLPDFLIILSELLTLAGKNIIAFLCMGNDLGKLCSLS